MTCRVLQAPSSGGGSGGAKTAAAPTAPPRHPTFSDYVTTSFMRRISPATFEIISRSGIRWHNAANKALVIAVLRNYIIDNDIDGLADHYNILRDKSDKGEKKMVAKFLRSAQHAARQHREYIAFIINRLFEPTPNEPQLVHVKEAVFGVAGGGAIIPTNHEAMMDLRRQPKGAHTLLTYLNILSDCWRAQAAPPILC